MQLNRMKIDLTALLRSAESTEGVTTFFSDIKEMAQIADEERVLIVTINDGYLSVNKKDIPKLVEELMNIYEW